MERCRPARRIAAGRLPRPRALLSLLLVGVAVGAMGCRSADWQPPNDGSPVATATPDGRPSGAGEDRADQAPTISPAIDRLPLVEATLHSTHGPDGDGPSDGDRVEEDRRTLLLRVADTPEVRARGLMGVPELPDGVGMLFAFPAPTTGAFWMRDTLVPLDIAFLDEGGTIVSLLAMEPCVEDPCPHYEPDVAYVDAVEVRQGWFADAGIGVGDRVAWDQERTRPEA